VKLGEEVFRMRGDFPFDVKSNYLLRICENPKSVYLAGLSSPHYREMNNATRPRLPNARRC
jgi:hypothetical protein